jgi:hypothetical protein
LRHQSGWFDAGLLGAPASRAQFVDGSSLAGQYAAGIEPRIQAEGLQRLHDFIEVFKGSGQGEVARLLPYFASLFSLDDIGAYFHSLRFQWPVRVRVSRFAAAIMQIAFSPPYAMRLVDVT